MEENKENEKESMEENETTPIENTTQNVQETDSDDDPEIIELVKTLETYSTGNHTIDIIRKTPLFCAGFCGTFPVEGIGLEDIRASWGGERYQFRFVDARGRIVARRRARIADVPRNNGKQIDAESWGHFISNIAEQNKAANPTAHAPTQTAVSVPLPQTENPLIPFLREIMDRQTEMIDRLLKANEQPQKSYQPLGEMLDAMTQLRDFSGAFSQQNEPNPMMEMFKMLMETKEQKRNSAERPQRKIIVVRPRVNVAAPAGVSNPGQTPEPGSIPSPEPPPESGSIPSPEQPPEDDQDVVEKFAALPVEEIAANVAKIFENMDPEERQRALSILMSNANI